MYNIMLFVCITNTNPMDHEIVNTLVDLVKIVLFWCIRLKNRTNYIMIYLVIVV